MYVVGYFLLLRARVTCSVTWDGSHELIQLRHNLPRSPRPVNANSNTIILRLTFSMKLYKEQVQSS